MGVFTGKLPPLLIKIYVRDSGRDVPGSDDVLKLNSCHALSRQLASFLTM